MTRKEKEKDRVIVEFLGSAHVFASAITEVKRRVLKQIAKGEINYTQLKILKLLSVGGEHNVGDVAAFLSITTAAASKNVDKMVRLGMVKRIEGSRDRRAAELSATESGLNLVNVYERARNERMVRAFQDYKPCEIEAASKLLDSLSTGIVNHSIKPERTCLQCGVFFRENECLMLRTVGHNCSYQQYRTRKTKGRAVNRLATSGRTPGK